MIYIDPIIKEKLKTIRLAYLSGDVSESKKFDINKLINRHIVIPDLDSKNDINSATRNAYKILGKQPSRYRPSAEALIRRVKKGVSLFVVNDMVDVVNYVSLSTGFSISLFDHRKIQGIITLKIGDETPYQTIGKGMMNIRYLPSLYDDLGPFGNPTSDSIRTKVTGTTNSILLIIYDFGQHTELSKTLDKAELFLKKYCNFSCNEKGIC